MVARAAGSAETCSIRKKYQGSTENSVNNGRLESTDGHSLALPGQPCDLRQVRCTRYRYQVLLYLCLLACGRDLNLTSSITLPPSPGGYKLLPHAPRHPFLSLFCPFSSHTPILYPNTCFPVISPTLVIPRILSKRFPFFHLSSLTTSSFGYPRKPIRYPPILPKLIIRPKSA